MNISVIRKHLVNALTILCPVIVVLVFSVYGTCGYSVFAKWLILFLTISLCVVGLILKIHTANGAYKLLLIINALLAFFVAVYSWLYYHDLLYIFSSVGEFKKYIMSTGSRGVFVYILIQVLQVVFLPIPAAVICIAGALIYGPLLGCIYCSIGVIIGSIISFGLGRVFGYRLVSWVAGKQNAIKYANVISSKGKLFLPLAFLLPLFPDDILCLIAGITNMKFGYFVFVTTIFRPISVISMAYFGGGYIIPFSGWWLYLWGAIIILMIAVVYLTTKYQNKIETWIIQRLKK